MIAYKQEKSIARIVLQKKPLNILSMKDLQELIRVLTLIKQTQTKVIVIESSLDTFSAGFDIKEHTSDKLYILLKVFNDLAVEFLTTQSVIITTVKGVCLGGMFEIALLSDVILASESAKFGLPEIKLAHMPPLAIHLLPQLLSDKQVADIILTGREITAKQAYMMGIISQLYSPEGYEEACLNYIRQFKNLSLAAISCNIKALRHIKTQKLKENLSIINNIYLEELSVHKDSQEGIDAFLEKREPEWV